MTKTSDASGEAELLHHYRSLPPMFQDSFLDMLKWISLNKSEQSDVNTVQLLGSNK